MHDALETLTAAALLWVAGTPVALDVPIHDLANAQASVDLDALALAQWAVGRLQGRGPLDVRAIFWAPPGGAGPAGQRPAGPERK